MLLEVTTANEMIAIEQAYLVSSGLKLADLMEKAGQSVAKEILKDKGTRRITIVSGKGNNGGDGFVCARVLAEEGRTVTVFVLAGEKDLTPEAGEAFRKLKETPVKIVVLSPKTLTDLKAELDAADLIVDAIFGIGFRGVPRNPAAQVIKLINQTSVRKLSVDIPSGVEADSGRVSGPAVRADKTITFICPKIGLLVGQGREYAGQVRLVDLNVPFDIIKTMSKTQVLTGDRIISLLPSRPREIHKKECGRVFVLAGSTGMTGAAYLTSQAAIKSGAGLVTLGIPSSLNPIMEVKLTEAMTLPLPETPVRSLDKKGLDQILEFSSAFDVLAMGPGLTVHPSTRSLVHELIVALQKPLVLDADGLNAVASKPELFQRRSFPTIITPHPGELARLLGKTADEIQENRLDLAQLAAKEFGVNVILKGAQTVITDGRKTAINPTGNAGMASAGTGDVLTGMIASFWAQGAPTFDAACLGVYLHGLAGDLAAKELTEFCLTAEDLIKYLPQAIKAVSNR